jgi:hypothetical protein
VRAGGVRPAAAAALGPGRGAWLGDLLEGAGAAGREGVPLERYALDLEVPLGDGATHIAIRKAALIEIGPLVEQPDHSLVCVPFSWRAATMAPLFPVFSGRLCWAPGEVRIDGWYAPPGGAIGAAADRILLRLVAQRTARWLLGRAVAAIEQAAEDEPRGIG